MTIALFLFTLLAFGLFYKCIDWFERIWSTIKPFVMTILFILSLLSFVYLAYVLVRPEEFWSII